MRADARRRAIAFMTAIDDTCAEATVACPAGTVLDSRHPALWSEATPGQLVASRVAAQAEIGRDARIGRQLASRDALIGSVVAVRRLAIRADGEIAARCQIYGDGAVAQIENLHTAAAWRGQGLSRQLMRHAVAEARAGRAELVFLVADAGDWQQSFYRRLGFDDAGLMPRFLRR